MASYSVNCPFTFHNFAWPLMEKKLFISREALARKRYRSLRSDTQTDKKITKPQDYLTNEKNNITNAIIYFPDNTTFGDCLQQPS